MLFYSTIEQRTLELLKKLMLIEEFKNLRLVGGTSLALQIGHRMSIDLDLFGVYEMDEIEINKILRTLGNVTILKQTKNIKIYLIDGIKVDFVNYHYPWLEESILEDNLRLASISDIAAMKCAAITGRGSKKDFIDLYFILKLFNLNDILFFYKRKYNDASEILAIKSMSYFDDADEEEDPIMLVSIKWKKVKESLIKTLKAYLK